jgi:hypothetical protein
MGNEAADKKAKKAASGVSSDTLTLSLYLRKVLLLNPVVVRQHHNMEDFLFW